MTEAIDEETRLAMFMSASPFFVDIGENEKSTISERFDHLPQNIHDLMSSEKTAAIIWNVAVVANGLSVDQVKSLAHLTREALTGDQSAANFFALVKERLGVEDAVANSIVKEISSKLIAPNYFQISQLFEKNHSKNTASVTKTAPRQPLAGRPLESFEQKRATSEAVKTTPGTSATSMSDWAGEAEEVTPPIVANKPSRNVVDLRKSTDPTPSKLPPTPPIVSRPE
jgi:hypothetical protein